MAGRLGMGMWTRVWTGSCCVATSVVAVRVWGGGARDALGVGFLWRERFCCCCCPPLRDCWGMLRVVLLVVLAVLLVVVVVLVLWRMVLLLALGLRLRLRVGLGFGDLLEVGENVVP